MSRAEEIARAITPQMMVDVLRNFPANGKPPANDSEYLVWMHMEAAGLIESVAHEQPCRTCGKPRLTGSSHKITHAGRILRDFADQEGS